MQLVEINDIRAGQIYKRDNVLYLIRYTLFNFENTDPVWICIEYGEDYQETESMFNGNDTVDSVGKKGYELIGFLGITHKIENEKLVEIPRKEFEVDDVFYEFDVQVFSEYGDHVIIDRELVLIDDPSETDEYLTFITFDGKSNIDYKKNDVTPYMGFEKIGILGVNYEFVNNKLITEEEVELHYKKLQLKYASTKASLYYNVINAMECDD